MTLPFDAWISLTQDTIAAFADGYIQHSQTLLLPSLFLIVPEGGATKHPVFRRGYNIMKPQQKSANAKAFLMHAIKDTFDHQLVDTA